MIFKSDWLSPLINLFWLAIALSDPSFDEDQSAEQLRDAGALRIVLMPEAER